MVGAQRGLYTFLPTIVGDKVVKNQRRLHFPEIVGDNDMPIDVRKHNPEPGCECNYK